MPHALFPLGKLYSTPGALATCESCSMSPAVLLRRHVTGDWSDMSRADQAANWRAITEGSRVFAAYQLGAHRLFVITEADRSSTTILLAEEY